MKASPLEINWLRACKQAREWEPFITKEAKMQLFELLKVGERPPTDYLVPRRGLARTIRGKEEHNVPLVSRQSLFDYPALEDLKHIDINELPSVGREDNHVLCLYERSLFVVEDQKAEPFDSPVALSHIFATSRTPIYRDRSL
eukprot:gene16326-19420_t